VRRPLSVNLGPPNISETRARRLKFKMQKSKRLILLRSTLTLWQCAAKVTCGLLTYSTVGLTASCSSYTLIRVNSFNMIYIRAIVL